jgi:hypothetical protein
VSSAVFALAAAVPAQAVTLFFLDFGPDGRPEGSVSIVSDTAFDLTGGNSGNEGTSSLRGIADSNFAVSGSWSYLTSDLDGANWDPAGYFVNNDLFQLTDSEGNDDQSGMFSFDVLAGDQFGFYVFTTDGDFGAATFSVSNLSPAYTLGGSVVPEPESWAMLIAGFGLVGATMRRRRRHVVLA